MTYQEFIAGKYIRQKSSGFTADEKLLPDGLFDWQKVAVRWAVKE